MACLVRSVLLTQDKMPSDVTYQAALAAIDNTITWLDVYGTDACAWLDIRMAEQHG